MGTHLYEMKKGKKKGKQSKGDDPCWKKSSKLQIQFMNI